MKFPKIRMAEIRAVMVDQNNQDVYLANLKNLLEVCLIDYYSNFSKNRLVILAIDPSTSAQIADYNCRKLRQTVRENLHKWIGRVLYDEPSAAETYHMLQEKMARLDEYHLILQSISWYHLKARSRIKSHIDNIGREGVSLNAFLNVVLYLFYRKNPSGENILQKLIV